MNTHLKKSAPLMCGALLASIMGVTEIASAEPSVIDIFTVTSGGTSPASVMHQFGTTETYGFGSAPAYPLTISSGPSSREGWQYEITWDLTAYDTSFFPSTDTFDVFMGIKPPGTDTPISEIQVKDSNGDILDNWIDLTGNGTGFTEGSIEIGVLFSELQPTGSGNEFFTIQWNQVPAPGALALLGLAGFAPRRRRR